METKKSLRIINTLFILSIIFILYALGAQIYSISKENASNFWLVKTLVLYVTLASPYLYLIYQLKCIIKNSSQNNLFCNDTVTRFKKISYSIFSFNLHFAICIYYLTNVPVTISNNMKTKTIFTNVIADHPILVLSSIKSPIIPLFVVTILSYVFYLISKTLEESVKMKNELDEVI